MLKKNVLGALVVVWACLPMMAGAADKAIECRLKGGSVVPLPEEACAREGGAPALATAPVAPEVDAASLSRAPGLAAAQRAVMGLLNRPVLEKRSGRREPESIERVAKFEECKLAVEEYMQVDHGNMFSSRMDFKVDSSVDFRRLGRDDYGVMGRVNSLGGGLKAHAVYFEESRRNGKGAIAIAVQEKREDGSLRSYRLPGPVAYWDAPHDDLWMADEYGYPKGDSMGNLSAVTVRVLYLLGSAEEADALKKALDGLRTLCGP